MNKKEIIETARKRFDRLMESEQELRTMAAQDRKFYVGDADNLLQWDDAVIQARKKGFKPMLTINKTKNHVSLVVNPVRENPPAAQILAATDGDTKAAQMMAGLVRQIESQSNAKKAYTSAMNQLVQGGHGGWFYTYDFAAPDSFDYEIKVNAVTDPDSILVDENKKFGFVFEDISEEEFKERYPRQDLVSFEQGSNWYSKESKRIKIALYWFCKNTDDELLLFEDGSSGYKSELGEAIHVKSRKVIREKWHLWKITASDTPLEMQEWPGRMLPIVFIEGDCEIIEGQKYRKGLVRNLKDPARMLNYWASEATHQVALQNKAKFQGPAEHWETYSEFYKNPDSDYLPTVAFNAEGLPIPAPVALNPPQMASAFVTGMEFSERQFGQASGQFEAQFGARSNESSGRAINARKAQSETANFHFVDALEEGIVYGTRVMIDLVQQTYDSERVVNILGIDNQSSFVKIQPDLQQSYAATEKPDGSIEKLFNPKLLKCDIAIGTGPSYRTQREGAQDALTQILPNLPALAQAAPDLLLKSFDLPHADLMAQRMKKLLPPNLIEGEDDDNALQNANQKLMQSQQQIEAMMAEGTELGQAFEQAQQALQAAQDELRAAKLEADSMRADKDIKMRELDLKELEFETKVNDSTQSSNEKQSVVEPQSNELDNVAAEAFEEVSKDVVELQESINSVSQSVEVLAIAQADIIERLQRPINSTFAIDMGDGRIIRGTKTEVN